MLKFLRSFVFLGFVLSVSVVLGADIRVAFLTDLHVTPGNEWEKGLYKVIEEINNEPNPFDFAVITGDLTNRGSDDELYAAKKAFDGFKIPYYVIPGNHETCWCETAGQTYLEIWGDDRFEFEFNGVYFLGFSTGPYNKMGDGHVKAEDLRWIEKTLSEKVGDSGKPVISLAHYPLNGQLDLGNWPQITSLLKKYNTIAAFCGHGHAVRLYNFDSIPGIMGRPLMFPGDPLPGYNIIEIEKDRILYGHKKLGEEVNITYTFRFGDPEIIKDVPVDPLPAPIGGDQPEGVEITEILAENASVFTGTAVHEGIVYYGNSLGELKAWDSKAKKNLWSVPFGFGASFYSTPLYGEGLIVVGTTKKEIVALDAKTGDFVWRIPAHSPMVNDGCIQNGFLYMGLGREDFCKIELKTGKILWTYTGVSEIFQGAPSIAEGKVVFGAWDRHLYCLDEATGKELWKWNNGHSNKLYSPANVIPVIGKKQVVLVAPDRRMTALNIETGEQIWRTDQYKVRESMGCNPDRSVAYAKTMDGEVLAVAMDRDEFHTNWVCDTKIGYEHVACPILESEGIVYIGSRSGIVVAIDAKDGKRLYGFKSGNSAVNRLTADENGDIWFSNIEGKIYRIRDGVFRKPAK